MNHNDNVSEVRRAGARVAGLYAHGSTPSPEAERAARQGLAYQRIQREVRRANRAASPALSPAQVGHLVALLVEGVDREAAERLERAVREAAFSVRLRDDERHRIAQIILDGGAA
ncbi:hypothetical protein [uncultured Nocardioides sp.]|uniref:hypothetical protein n=1 Tax=uncultured Nocardioides sp. TaxID=198441 RepID=UPI00262B3127|nr:hypothetical protein [uncultured Nocardioides sp.]